MINYYVVYMNDKKELDKIAGFEYLLDAEMYRREQTAKRNYDYVIMSASEYEARTTTDPRPFGEIYR